MTKIGGYKIKNITLIKAGNGYNKEYRSSYNRYRVLVSLLNGSTTPLEQLYDKTELKNLNYWSTRSELMAMTCWGISQEFEAQLALASFFNMKIENEEWPNYTKRVKEIIKIM